MHSLPALSVPRPLPPPGEPPLGTRQAESSSGPGERLATADPHAWLVRSNWLVCLSSSFTVWSRSKPPPASAARASLRPRTSRSSLATAAALLCARPARCRRSVTGLPGELCREGERGCSPPRLGELCKEGKRGCSPPRGAAATGLRRSPLLWSSRRRAWACSSFISSPRARARASADRARCPAHSAASSARWWPSAWAPSASSRRRPRACASASSDRNWQSSGSSSGGTLSGGAADAAASCRSTSALSHAFSAWQAARLPSSSRQRACSTPASTAEASQRASSSCSRCSGNCSGTTTSAASRTESSARSCATVRRDSATSASARILCSASSMAYQRPASTTGVGNPPPTAPRAAASSGGSVAVPSALSFGALQTDAAAAYAQRSASAVPLALPGCPRGDPTAAAAAAA
mmetsp:Transcript_79241/g.246755  ORF Transcript_79241/g.246755 Transcript_79241/m.246755 type:complete len:409 (-) Transcript_79241:1529-2755(-)